MRYLTLLMLFLAGCRSTVRMEVASEQGSFTRGSLRPATWELGEIRICQRVKCQGDDLLICGTQTLDAWGQLTEQQIKQGGGMGSAADAAELQILTDAKTFAVTRRGSGPTWQCKKTADGLDCE